MPQYQGVWNLAQQAQALTRQQWVTDPVFDQTTLLLQADNAANSAQNNTFLDSSNNSFAITRNGNTTQGTFSPFSQTGWSNYFNGSSDGISVGNSSSLLVNNDFTWECWAYFNSLSNTVCLINVGTTTSDRTLLYFDSTSGITYVVARSLTNQVIIQQGSTSGWSAGTWYHIALVRNGNNYTIYRNGTSVASGTSSYSQSLLTSNVNIGFSNASGSNLYFNGYISNARIVNGTAVYTAAFTPPTSALTAITNTSLLTCQSNRFVDNSSNAFAITANGTPSVQAFSPFAPQYQYTPTVTGGSGYFDGTGDYLTAANNAAFNVGTGDFSMEAWVYMTGTGSASIAGNGSSGFVLYMDSVASGRKIRFSEYGVAAIITGATAVTNNAWNHILVTRSGTTIRAFLNGVLDATATSSANFDTTTSLQIGADGDATTPGSLMLGYISNYRFVKGSIPTSYQTSSTTIGASIFTPPTAPVTISSQGSSAPSILCNFTNAGIYDGTMKNNLETVGNAQVSTSVVKYGSGSMYFDGTGDYLVIPSGQNTTYGTGDFTIETWVYCANTATGSIQIIYDQRSTNTQAVPTLYIDTNGNLQYYVSGANRITYSGVVPAGAWNHVAVSRVNSNTRMFLNGVQVGSTYSDTTTYISNPVGVGAYLGSPSLYLNGYLDDMRVTKGIARYTRNFTPPQVALPRQ